MKKVGIIRCQQTEDICPGTTDFKVPRWVSWALRALAPQRSLALSAVVVVPASELWHGLR